MISAPDRVRALVPLVAALLAAASLSQATPVFPIYGISVDPRERPTQNDLALIAQNYIAIQDSNLTPSDIATMIRANPSFAPLHYLNSGVMSSTARSIELEHYDLKSIAMVRTATLASNIGAGTTTFTLARLSDTGSLAVPTPVPIKPSTSTTGGTESPTHCITWINIDGELMQITDWDASTRSITVVRGFNGTRAASHSAGAWVLTPVYVNVNGGKRRAGFPGSTGLYYALDVSSQAAIDWLVGTTPMNPSATQACVDLTSGSYRGMWYDVLQSSIYAAEDMNGNPVNAPFDFSTGGDVTPSQFAAFQQSRLASAERALSQEAGFKPYLVANSLGNAAYWPSGANLKGLLQSGLLNGYCMENWAGTTNGTPQGITYIAYKGWVKNIQALMDAAQSGLRAFPMIANAGAKSAALEPESPRRDAYEYWAYASYLMAVESSAATALGLPAYTIVNGGRHAWVNPILTYPIGEPTESVSPTNLNRYRGSNKYTYLRTFTGGVVLVNPDNSNGETVNLGGTFYDPDNGYTPVTSCSMTPKSGKILLRRTPVQPQRPR